MPKTKIAIVMVAVVMVLVLFVGGYIGHRTEMFLVSRSDHFSIRMSVFEVRNPRAWGFYRTVRRRAM